MKKLLIAIVLSLPTLATAQNVFLIEDMVTTDDVSVNAYIFNIKGEFDAAIDSYKDYVKQAYEYKVEKENKTTYMIEAVDLPHISTKRADLKTYLFHTDTMNVMAFSFLLGYDVFLTSKDQPEEMAQFKKYVIDFMDFQYKAYYADLTDNQTKALEKFKKELAQNENKISSLKKDVVSLAKKEAKEEDASKKVAINAKKKLAENEIVELTDRVADMRVDVITKEKALFKLKEELNQYHLDITAL